MDRIGLMRKSIARTAAAATLALALPGTALAQWWNPYSPYGPGSALDEKSFVATPWLIQAAAQVIREAMAKRDFAKIERMHDEFLGMLQSGGGGGGMLMAFDNSFGWFAGKKPDELQAFFSQWHAAMPQSKVLPAAEAEGWAALAWAARGSGYASSVTPEGWALFRERLERATKVLDAGAATGKQSPLWYKAALNVAGALGEPAPVMDAIFEEGAKKYPYSYPIYRTRLNYLLPQWGGDYGVIDAFIRSAVARMQAVNGTVSYANLYRYVLRNYRGKDFFGDTKASWRIMKHAFEDGLSQRTDVPSLNTYATVACVAEDAETLSHLLDELGPRAELGDGIPGVSADACLELAREFK